MMNVQKIQRPTLFEPFFNLLLTWSNEVIDCVQTSNNIIKQGVTPSHKIMTSTSNIIKSIINKSFTYITNVYKLCIRYLT